MDSSTTWKQRLLGALGALTVAGVVPALCGCAADALADAIPSAAFSRVLQHTFEPVTT